PADCLKNWFCRIHKNDPFASGEMVLLARAIAGDCLCPLYGGGIIPLCRKARICGTRLSFVRDSLKCRFVVLRGFRRACAIMFTMWSWRTGSGSLFAWLVMTLGR